MARPRKTIEFNDVSHETAPEPVKEVSKVNVKHLQAILWKAKLDEMQEAVSDIQGDEGTMRAVEGVLKSPNSGIAAQYLQQIIQRNS